MDRRLNKQVTTGKMSERAAASYLYGKLQATSQKQVADSKMSLKPDYVPSMFGDF